MGFFEKAPRILKEPDVEPGYESLLKYGAMKNDHLRPPPREELVKAFRDFFKHKKFNRRPVNSMQARVSHHVLKHLSEPADREAEFALTVADLRTAQDALMKRPRDKPEELVEFSKSLFLEIGRLQTKERQIQIRLPKTGEKRKQKKSEVVIDVFDTSAMMRVLSQYGASIEARDHLLNVWPTFQNDPKLGYGRSKGLWLPVLRGLAEEGKEKELLDFLSIMREKSGIPYGRSVHETMTVFYARRDDAEKMMEWFNKPILADSPAGQEEGVPANPGESEASPRPTLLTYTEVFRYAIRNNDRDWAISIYEDIANDLERLLETHYATESLLIVYRFAVLLLDKGPEHIEHMFLANPNPKFQPNMTIINTVIEAAMEKKDLYLAERLTTLVSTLGLEPDRSLYSLQIEYRIRANDLGGAYAAYESLQSFESDDEDWPVLNRLIRALCSLPAPSHDKVLNITSYLEQLSATLEPETVVSLCMAFLRNDEQLEVIDTLSLHTIHFSWGDRAMVSNAFVDYCLDSKNSTARVWDAYALLRQFFPDMGLAERVKIMDAFFDRRRGDMACHVFGHMRQHGNQALRPTIEIYTSCLEGIGRCPDLESLKVVHNMLKMDTTIQPNTKVYNALMIAYVACDEPYRALEFWKDIGDSIEGPSYQSLEIVFRTYEVTPFGHEPAAKLWDKLHMMEIDTPPNVLTAYVGTLAGHSQLEEAKKLLEEMEAEVGQRPDIMT